MKMVKSLLLGGAAGLVALTGAQAADLPVKAAPVQYVKVCSLYGAGFYYMPGTDTCLKVGGYVRFEVNVNAGGSFGLPTASGGFQGNLYQDNRNGFLQDWRSRAAVTLDARSQTAFGTLRSYMFLSATDDNSGRNSANADPGNSGQSGYTRLYAPAAFIQWAGFTAGKTDSFFSFDTNPYTNASVWWGSASGVGGNGEELIAYTAHFGGGWSATISAENAQGYNEGITNGKAGAIGATYERWAPGATTVTYGNQSWPDIVGNLRVDEAWGSAQVMGQLHDVRSSDNSGLFPATTGTDATGYAIGGGLKLNLPMFGAKDYVVGQVTYSKGIMRTVAGNSDNFFTANTGYPITSAAIASTYDAVVTNAAGNLDLTKGFSFTGGFEHFWNAQWKTSLWGDYGKLTYSDAASAVLAPTGTTGNASWSMWNIGSRTVWTPVQNLDLSVEVMYNSLTTGFAGTATAPAGGPGITVANRDWVSGIFRVQRNFYP